MSLDNDRLHFLVKSLVDNKIDKEELKELSEILKAPENESAMHLEMKNVWTNTVEEQTDISKDVYLNIISDARFSQTQENTKKVFSIFNNKNIISYAAALLLISGVALGLYLFKHQNSDSGIARLATNNTAVNKIENSEKAILTLSDGREIVLDQAKSGELAQEKNAVISKTADGQVVYNLSALKQTATNKQLTYNTITTPKGGNYQVILPDGTKVWLNAMSSLKFPVAFAGEHRNVELTGEGYFEVAKDKTKPFVVVAKDMKVRVLGTHFNVSAYDDDSSVKTSLLEGSVKAETSSSSILIKPGQQAYLLNGSSSINVKDIDVDEIIAWKNGYFVFRNEPIESIMKKISRWYDIEVNYQGNLSGKEFGGKYLKTNTLSELLKSLELTGTINFKVEGRRVTVMQ